MLFRSATTLIARTVALEGIADRRTLDCFLEETDRVVRDDEAIYVHWQDTAGRWDRRSLSSVTACALVSIAGPRDWPKAIARFEDALTAASRTHNVAIPSNLDELLQAASCWLLESVPPTLAAMVVGALRINALPPAVIARRAAQRPLRRNEQSADLPASAEGTYARVVDALVAVPTGASTASREFLVDAQRVLARHAKEARGVALTKIFSELVGFRSEEHTSELQSH